MTVFRFDPCSHHSVHALSLLKFTSLYSLSEGEIMVFIIIMFGQHQVKCSLPYTNTNNITQFITIHLSKKTIKYVKAKRKEVETKKAKATSWNHHVQFSQCLEVLMPWNPVNERQYFLVKEYVQIWAEKACLLHRQWANASGVAYSSCTWVNKSKSKK